MRPYIFDINQVPNNLLKAIYRNSGTLDSSVGRWTLDAGSWTLDSRRWALDAGPWKLESGRWTLDARLWTLDTEHCFRTLFHCFRTLDNVSLDFFRTESESSFWFYLIKLMKFFGCESLRTPWSRLFCRDYWFWRGYF